jgi:uncharacterized protein (TIGR02996 family)
MAAIIANPDEDTPRLALADWLQEHGDEHDQARAEFIRLQIEEDNLPWREVVERKRLADAARKLETKHRRAWLAPLHALDRTTPPGHVSFSRGLLHYLPLNAGAFLKPSYQRALPDALAAVGVESINLNTPTTRTDAVVGSVALRWISGLMTTGMGDDALRALGGSPNCAHLSGLFLFDPRVTDAGLHSFAKTTATARLRRFELTAGTHRRYYSARGVRAVLNTRQLPLVSSLALHYLGQTIFPSELILRGPATERLTRLELTGPLPMAAVLACEHLRQLRTLIIHETIITDADANALFTSPTLARLMNLKLAGANRWHPRLSEEVEARLAERFGPDAITYSPVAQPPGR